MTNQYSVILRAINDKQQKFDLELTNSPDFLLDISAIEAGDIGKVFGISSQEFALPGTDTNNQFFNNVFDMGTTPAVGLTHTVPCQVLVDGQAVYTGKLYLNSVVTDQENDIVYNCAVVNETIDFRARVDNRALADLDWSAYNHTYNWTNISASWNDQLYNGDIFYPLVHYGKDPNNANSAQLEFGGGNFQIDNPNYPLLVTDFKPAIKAKAVVDTIFSSSGFTYESSFFTSSLFNQLYLLPTSNNFKGATINSTTTQSCYVYPSSNQDIAWNTPTTVVFDQEIYDNGNNFNTSTNKYIADVGGQYTVNVVIPFNIQQFAGVDPDREVIIQVFKNGDWSTGTEVAFFYKYLKNINGGTIGFNPFTVTLGSGDTLEVSITFSATQNTEEFRVFSGQNTFLKVQGPPGVQGGTVEMGLQFPDDFKVLDFMNGLISKFNLVVEPKANSRNVLVIEPFNDWVDRGVGKDWTEKVDRNVKWEIRHPLGQQPKNLLFTDQTDEDVINKYQNNTYRNTYGERTYSSDSDLTSGEKTISTPFGATPVKAIPNSQTVVVPFLYKQEPDKYGQPYKFKPRLLFKQALQTVTGTEALGTSGSAQGYFYVNKQDGSATFPINYYRTLGPNTTKNVDFNTGFDIHFDNLDFYPYQQNTVNGRTQNDAYTNYWAYYINELYDVDTRLVTMNIVLNPDEIQKIQLNDKIFIDGHYYRINKIQGANLIERQSTKVELLKTLPRKLPFPRRRIYYELPDKFKDVIQGTFTQGGTTVYNDFETNEVVTDPVIISQAATRDQNVVFGSTVVWDTTKPVIYNPNVKTVGVVDYDETSNNVFAVGSNVVIPQGTNNVAVLTPTRTASFAPDTTYIGTSVVQSRAATEYAVVSLRPNDNYYLTSSATEYPYYLLAYSGSETGSNYVWLPDANEVDGVEYQFQISSSYGSGKNVLIVPSGSQTIKTNAGDNDSQSLTVTGSLYAYKAVNGNWVNTINPGAAGTGGSAITSSATAFNYAFGTDPSAVTFVTIPNVTQSGAYQLSYQLTSGSLAVNAGVLEITTDANSAANVDVIVQRNLTGAPTASFTATYASQSLSVKSTFIGSNYIISGSYAPLKNIYGSIGPQGPAGPSGSSTNTGSLLTTASINNATLTFTKGDASTFNVTVNNVTQSISASYASVANVSNFDVAGTIFKQPVLTHSIGNSDNLTIVPIHISQSGLHIVNFNLTASDAYLKVRPLIYINSFSGSSFTDTQIQFRNINTTNSINFGAATYYTASNSTEYYYATLATSEFSSVTLQSRGRYTNQVGVSSIVTDWEGIVYVGGTATDEETSYLYSTGSRGTEYPNSSTGFTLTNGYWDASWSSTVITGSQWNAIAGNQVLTSSVNINRITSSLPYYVQLTGSTLINDFNLASTQTALGSWIIFFRASGSGTIFDQGASNGTSSLHCYISSSNIYIDAISPDGGGLINLLVTSSYVDNTWAGVSVGWNFVNSTNGWQVKSWYNGQPAASASFSPSSSNYDYFFSKRTIGSNLTGSNIPSKLDVGLFAYNNNNDLFTDTENYQQFEFVNNIYNYGL